jgi:hypothetical protein
VTDKPHIPRLTSLWRRPDPPAEGQRPTQAQINGQLRAWRPRRIASWSLMILGVVVAVQHLVAHAGTRPLPLSMGWQDILFGYPAAAMLGIAGLVLIDPRPRI